jgi:hypothetical protein
MNKIIFSFFFILFAQNLKASDICSRTSQDIRSYLDEKSSRMSFKNDGGLFNQGVCWWHNRLQRSSAYLITFEPASPVPSRPEVLKILMSLRNMDSAVVIPGYEDFSSFSQDFKKEIQSMLDGWQKYDGFYNFEWIRGVSGRSSLSIEEMRLRMVDVYTHYKTSPAPLWIMAQIKGVTSHSFLVVKMRELEHGYELEVIDSNLPEETRMIHYYVGDTSLKVDDGKYTFVPYVGFQNDFRKIASALRLRCGDKEFPLDLRHLKDGQIER